MTATQLALSSCPEDLPDDLHYVDDTLPGLTRHRKEVIADNGKGAGKTPAAGSGSTGKRKMTVRSGVEFFYLDRNGQRVVDEKVLSRIRSLAIPPAYEDVWICADARGHLQATGRDARGRKQYRYHPRWRESRDANKYERMLAFGAALPRIRARVTRDLGLRGMPRDKVLATVVRLLDTTLIRVGNADYARENHSFGLTTLRNRHVKFSDGELRFQFRGKSGVHHDVAVTDAKVARIVKRCMELPGHELFQYLDKEGHRHGVDSSAINDYLRACSGGDFTAKDYRTWAGTVFALASLKAKPWETQAEARKHMVSTIKDIASRLGNTAAVCKRCYVHPAVLELYEAGQLDVEPACASGLGSDLESKLASELGSDLAAGPSDEGVGKAEGGKSTQRRKGLKQDEVALSQLLKRLSNEAARKLRAAEKTTPARKKRAGV